MNERKPRVLLVGRTRLSFPLAEGLARRYDALSAELDWRQLGTLAAGSPSEERFVLSGPFPLGGLDGAVYHLRLPWRVARELRRVRADAVVVQGAQETALVLLGRRLARSQAAVVLDLHGDWRVPTRLYGSRARRLLDPLADRLATIALRRADAVRTITSYTSQLVRAEGVEPAAEFPAYMDLSAFTARPVRPLPVPPRALFVGVLERYKAFDVLCDAWRSVAERLPDATLHVVGDGSLRARASALVAELPGHVEWSRAVPSDEVVDALDAATLLVLPSRSEGMGRVLVEAACRSRAAVGTSVGGISDVVVDGETGILVPADDAIALADALVRVLSDRALAERLGAAAHGRVERWLATPEEYARRVRDLVEKAIAATGAR